MDHENRPTIRRREMLRRAAVVGGSLIWAVPAVQTLAPKALAQSASPVFGCCECRSGAAGREKCNGLGQSYCFHASPSPLTCVDISPGSSPPRFACSDSNRPPGN